MYRWTWYTDGVQFYFTELGGFVYQLRLHRCLREFKRPHKVNNLRVIYCPQLTAFTIIWQTSAIATRRHRIMINHNQITTTVCSTGKKTGLLKLPVVLLGSSPIIYAVSSGIPTWWVSAFRQRRKHPSATLSPDNFNSTTEFQIG